MFKKSITIILALVIVLSVTTVSFGASSEPIINAGGAVVYCENTGEIVYSKNMDNQFSPYSTTKVLTALLAVQNLPLDQEVTVSAEAASQGGSTMDLVEGEKVTVEDLLYGTMLPSGNDAAYALAEAVSGDTGKFLKLMNETADNIGCKNTHFTSVNGLNNKTNLTTPYDMMQIIKVAFSNDVLRKISGTKSYKIPTTNKQKKRTIKTHISEIKDSKSGVYAAKTGYWDQNNASIVVGYKNNGLSLYIVLLGDTEKGRSEDIKTLVKYTTETVQGAKVFKKDEESGKIRIKHGVKTSLETYTKEIGYAYLPKEGSNSLISTKVVLKEDLQAPVKAGDVVGSYQIYVADELVNEVPVIIKESVDEGWFPSYIGISNQMTMIICAVVILLIILFFVIIIMRHRNIRRREKARQAKLMAIARKKAALDKEHTERDWRF